ncbi:SDR family NAD(P)-dependent oxidoreductase [Mycobacteroides abscessus]|uniref:SDR family NAD(P)-dependent oxidoreductase n=1 Tax=Mycobacteroides abscessus TaxID=36809 RepID=UPI000C25DDE7|nr:SDR family oxidoreductase [Mycobacteroides abscessus]MBE5460711.1 hypothetical protein [Mycobacteroides abscessus]QOF41488.1 hypothetical protein E3G69_000505 [Mycobacteroides abscessus]QOF46184.1 hypothetical protein E3G70_000501 [Mycobacteroides abscessus]
MPRTSLESKVVFVVGASSGLGRGFAQSAAAAGASVAITARRATLLREVVDLVESHGGRCTAFAADATDTVAAQRVIDDVIKLHGRIDIALLNVGGAPALDLKRLNADDITAYMRSNYDVAVNYLVPVLRQMCRQGSGTVIHTNSLAGWYGIPLQGPYSAAKAALRVLFDTYRAEYRGSGIRFVSIYPGFIGTERTKTDGMPAPGEIDEDTAVAHMIRAVTGHRDSYSFPRATATAVALGRILPTRVRHSILARMIPNP